MFLLADIADAYSGLFESITRAEVTLCLMVLPVLVGSVAVGFKDFIRVLRSYDRSFWIGTAGILTAALVVGLVGVPKTFWAMNMHGLELYQGLGLIQAMPDHGVLSSLTYWILNGGELHWFRPWGVSLFASMISGLLFTLWVRGWAGSASVALIATCMLLFSPVHLRMAPSMSGYLLVEMYLMLGLVGMELWFRTERKSHLRWCVAATCLAAMCRADAVVVVPFFFVAVVAARSRLSWAMKRTKDVGWIGVFLALIWLIRFATAVANPNSSLMVQTRFLAPIAGVLVVGIALGGFGLRWSNLSMTPSSSRTLKWAILVVAILGLWLAPWSFDDGAWPMFWQPVYQLVRAFPLLHPTLVSPVLALLVALALIKLGTKTSIGPPVLLLTQALMTFIHFVLIGEDSLSFFLRSGMMLLWGWTALAAYALATFLKTDRHTVGPKTIGVMLLVVFLGTLPYWRVITFWYPSQQQGRLLIEVLPSLDLSQDSRIVSLTKQDTPWTELPPDARWFPPTWRGQLKRQRSANGETFHSITESLASPEQFIGGIWFRSVSCYRPGRLRWRVPSPEENTPRKPTRFVYGAGRLWEPPTRPSKPNGGITLPVFGPKPALVDLPCLAHPDEGQCAPDQPKPCMIWTCDDAVTLSSDATYEDHMCTAMAETFELEAIDEEHLSNSSLDTDGWHPISQGNIGLYRITGLKDAPK